MLYALTKLDYVALTYKVFTSSGSLLTWNFLLEIFLPHLCIFTSYPSSLPRFTFAFSLALWHFPSPQGSLPSVMGILCWYISYSLQDWKFSKGKTGISLSLYSKQCSAQNRLQIICFHFTGMWASNHLPIYLHNLPYVRQ